MAASTMRSRASVTGCSLTINVAWSLEDYCQSMIILRHHRRPPTTSASLVQQVRQGIFIVAGVARKA
jgi:hypothetical protein